MTYRSVPLWKENIATLTGKSSPILFSAKYSSEVARKMVCPTLVFTSRQKSLHESELDSLICTSAPQHLLISMFFAAPLVLYLLCTTSAPPAQSPLLNLSTQPLLSTFTSAPLHLCTSAPLNLWTSEPLHLHLHLHLYCVRCYWKIIMDRKRKRTYSTITIWKFFQNWLCS